MNVPKPLRFLLVLAPLLAADTLVPRPPQWPAPLLPRERVLALLPWRVTPAPPPAPAPLVADARPAVDPRPLFGPELPPPMFGPELPPELVRKPRQAADEGTFVWPEDERWDALVDKMALLSAGQPRVVRVIHVGDSEIANDLVARTLRKLFVDRYGDAGPGFVLALAPWNWYERESFKNVEPESFTARSVALVRKGDGNFGPGGVAFDARSKEATAELKLDPGEHDSCEVALLYGVQPDGAELELLAGGKSIKRISTAAAEPGVSREELHLSPCPRKLAVKALGLPARVFGWSVEWGQPGVTWSPLGVVGASSVHFLRYGPGRIGGALAALRPDLLVVAHGLNVANRPSPPSAEERQGLERLLAELRQSAPDAACLVMSPYPIAYADGDQVNPSPSTAMLARMQRQVAQAQGCAFLDRLALEGGAKTATRWLNAHPRILSSDYVHLTNLGSEKVGGDVGQTLLHRFARGRDD